MAGVAAAFLAASLSAVLRLAGMGPTADRLAEASLALLTASNAYLALRAPSPLRHAALVLVPAVWSRPVLLSLAAGLSYLALHRRGGGRDALWASLGMSMMVLEWVEPADPLLGLAAAVVYFNQPLTLVGMAAMTYHSAGALRSLSATPPPTPPPLSPP